MLDIIYGITSKNSDDRIIEVDKKKELLQQLDVESTVPVTTSKEIVIRKSTVRCVSPYKIVSYN